MDTPNTSYPSNGIVAGSPQCVMVWTIPRNLATVFFKCLSFVPETRIFYEPYIAAFQARYEDNNDETILKATEIDSSKLPYDEGKWFDNYKLSMESINKQLEETVDNIQTTFCKDMSSVIINHLDMIPKGSRHAFLIRNPYRVLPSWKDKIARNILMYDEDQIEQVDFRTMRISQAQYVPHKYGYGETLELFHHLMQTSDELPMVIDADDLQNNPASVLKQFLEHFNISYNDSYLKWDSGHDFAKNWTASKQYISTSDLDGEHGWYYKAFGSSSFKPASPLPSRDSLTQDLRDVVDTVMPWYEEMYKYRIEP